MKLVTKHIEFLGAEIVTKDFYFLEIINTLVSYLRDYKYKHCNHISDIYQVFILTCTYPALPFCQQKLVSSLSISPFLGRSSPSSHID